MIDGRKATKSKPVVLVYRDRDIMYSVLFSSRSEGKMGLPGWADNRSYHFFGAI
jgi:hypothetical protein